MLFAFVFLINAHDCVISLRHFTNMLMQFTWNGFPFEIGVIFKGFSCPFVKLARWFYVLFSDDLLYVCFVVFYLGLKL